MKGKMWFSDVRPRRLGNPLFRSQERLTLINSIVVGSGILTMSIAAYAATRNPWSLLLIPVGLLLAIVFRALNFVPITVSISRERLIAEYLHPSRMVVISWDDVSEIEVVRRQKGLMMPEFFSLWFINDAGEKIRRLPIHISTSVLEEIKTTVGLCQLPIHFESKKNPS